MREEITIHVGQAGVQIGNAVWELYAAEHAISPDGEKMEECTEFNDGSLMLFNNTSTGKWCPRSIFVDLEPTVIDEVRSGPFKELFHCDYLITGAEDAANNFARGFFSLGKLTAENVMYNFRKIVESCDSPRSIVIYRSQGGGTGSGLTACLFDYLVDYGKMIKVEVPIYPAPSLSNAMTEPYNAVLSEHFIMDDMDISFLIDNEALFQLACNRLDFAGPTYTNINRVIAQACCSISAPTRFENSLSNAMPELLTNLVPYPRIHFPMLTTGPILNRARAIHEDITVTNITKTCFQGNSQLLRCNPLNHKFMSCSLIYRGDISPLQVYNTLKDLKNDKSLRFVDWAPSGFKVGITFQPPAVIPGSNIMPTSKQLTMLTNNGAIGETIGNCVNRFNLLFSRRSFVHWYVGEGLEECELTEAVYNLSSVVRDYEEACADFEPGTETENSATPEASGALEVGRDDESSTYPGNEGLEITPLTTEEINRANEDNPSEPIRADEENEENPSEPIRPVEETPSEASSEGVRM